MADQIPAGMARIVDMMRDGHPFWNYRCHGATLDWHKSRAKHRVLLGGNRSGKTYASSFDVATRLIGVSPWHDVPQPAKGLCVVPGLDQVGQVTWPTLQPFIEGYWLEHRTSWHDRKRGKPAVIRVMSLCGTFVSELHFMSDDQDTNKFSGPTWDFVYFDEHFSDDVFTEAAIRGTVDRNGVSMVSLTPIEPFPWLQMQEEKKPKDWSFYHRSTNENRISEGGFLPDDNIDGLWDGFVAAYGEDVAKARFEGLWYGLVGMCYPHFSRTTNVVPRIDTIPSTWDRYIGIDFGWSHPFVALWIAHDTGKDKWYVIDEYVKQHDYYRNHAAAIMAPHRPWPVDEFCVIIADSEDAQGRAELHELLGRATRGQAKQKDSVKRGIERVARLIYDRDLLICENCEETITEHMKYRWHPDKDEPMKEDDHTCDAVRGVIYTVTHNVTRKASDHFDRMMSEARGGFVQGIDSRARRRLVPLSDTDKMRGMNPNG